MTESFTAPQGKRIELAIGAPDYPILNGFMRSRARVACVIGPLGCTSGDTEYLTTQGWRRIDAYQPGDLVAQWDRGRGVLEWVEPLEYVTGSCESLIQFEAGNLSMQLSDDHRLPLWDYEGREVVRTAAELEVAPSRYTVPVSFDPGLPDAPLSDAQIRLGVAINADANLPPRGSQVIITVRKERKKERLRWLLGELGIPFTERTYPGRPTETIFAFPRTGWLPKRYLGAWWTLSRRQLAVVIDEMSHWDGLWNHAETRYFTTVKADADYIQYAAHATGGAATMRMRPGGLGQRDSWSVYIAREGSLKAARSIRIDGTKVSRVTPVDGRQYCFRVPSGFWVARHRNCVFLTGNSGKTFAACQRILAQMTEQPPNAQGVRPSRWLAVRNTRGEVMSTTAKDFLEVFSGLGDMRYGGDEPPEFKARFRLPDGTTVESSMIFLGLDRDDGVRRLRGQQITGVWLNEAKELQKAVVDMADGRHGRYPTELAGGVACGWHGMILDCNAPDTDHWLYLLAEEERPEGWEFYRQPGGVVKVDGRWAPNPAAENLRNLPSGYYTAQLAGKGDGFIRVQLANEYAFYVDGRPVHPEYIDAVHGASGLLEADPRYGLVVGVDFGRTPAAVVTQYLAHAQRWVLLDELGGTDMGATIFGPQLKRWLDQRWPGFTVKGYGDPAGDAKGQGTEDTPIQILRAHGIPIEQAPSNVPTLRRAAIEGPCTRLSPHGPGLLVSPACKMTRKGLMGGFAYRRLRITGDARFTDEPDKNQYSHYVEAAEYALLGGGENVAALVPTVAIHRGPRQEYAIMD